MALHTNSCRETSHGRMALPSVFPIISLFPQPVLEGNIHLQLLGYRKGLVQNVLQHHVQMENDGEALQAGTHLHYRYFLGTNSGEML